MNKTLLTILAFSVAINGLSQSLPRSVNIGISGPTMTAVGGPGPNFLKYNSNPDAGSAVRQGLMPPIRPFVDAQVRDAVVCIGHDGRYYMTGSTGDDIWRRNDGVELWVSNDLHEWQYLGLVWSFDRDGTWQKSWRNHRGPVRAIWAPEIHYLKGNYYITISMPPGDRGLLKSTTGLPEGPYVNALANDGKWDGDIDASLFQDDDGSVYVVWGGGWIARMNDDMSAMAEEPRKPILLSPDTAAAHHSAICKPKSGCTDIGHEGAFLFKRNGVYYLTAADTYEGRYSSMVAMSDNIYGPYRLRHEAVPCGGGTCYFKDKQNNWWCTFFGNDSQAPFREMPAMIRVDFANDGHVFPALKQPQLNASEQSQWSVRWQKVWQPRLSDFSKKQ